MKLDFLVHRAHESTASKSVEVNGEVISATIPIFEVELVSTHDGSGTYTHRFVGKDVTEAKEKFVTGEIVTFKLD